MQTIPLLNLFYLIVPVIVVWYFYKSWVSNKTEIVHAMFRMITQLLLIGYALLYLFENKNLYMGAFILSFMILVSAYISLRNLKNKTKDEYILITSSLGVSGLIHLFIVITFVLKLENIYEPQYVIPIAGMLFANIMNSLSLAIERFEKEFEINSDFILSREASFKAAMIPQINSLFAVGLVTLPGMMTGQILSGVDPLIAVRYQIMIMAILFSSTGLSIIIYFLLKEKRVN